jgi:two-component system sensor histidine kinase/response regulator
MTANGFHEDAVESLRNGMNAHISKPIDARTLFATLRGFLL